MKRIKKLCILTAVFLLLAMCGMMLASCGNDPADEEVWYIEKVQKGTTDYYPWSDYSEEQDGTEVFFSDSLTWKFTKGLIGSTVEVTKLDGTVLKGTYKMQKGDAVLDQYVIVDMDDGTHYEGYCRWYTVNNGFYVFMLECDEYSIWLTLSNGYSYADYQKMLEEENENSSEEESGEKDEEGAEEGAEEGLSTDN